MSLGTALSGLVNGFVDGRDIRHRWDDRITTNARNKRRDEILDAQEGRAVETHALSMESGGLLNDARRQAIRATEQGWNDDEAMRRAAIEAVDATNAALLPTMGATPSGAGAPPGQMPGLSFGPGVPSANVPAGGPSLSFGGFPTGPAGPTAPADAPTPMGAMPMQPPSMPLSFGGSLPAPAPAGGPALSFGGNSIFAQQNAPPAAPVTPPSAVSIPSDQILDLQSGPAIPPAVDGAPTDTPLFIRRDDGKLVTARPPRSREEVAMIGSAAKSGDLVVSEDSKRRQAEIEAQSPMGQLPQTQFGRDVAAVREGAGRAGLTMAESLANTGSDALNLINSPFRAGAEYFTGSDPIGPAARVGDLDGDGRERNIVSPILDLARPAPDKPAAAKAALAAEGKAKGEQDVAGGATAAMDALGQTPDMAAAAAATPAAEMGATRGRPMTPKQVETGSTRFMEAWRTNGAPIMIEALARQGRIEEAQQLDTWVKSADAQRGMELWAKGQFQAQMGDIMGAYDTWVDAFNENGYYDDGYEIVKDESELIRDKGGNPVGVSLTFRDQGTGETHTTVMTPEDMGQTFGLMLSPVEAFKASQDRQAALREQLLAAQNADREAARGMIATDAEIQQKAINEAALKMMEASQFSGQPITYDQALAQARAAQTGSVSAVVPEAAVPVARRPN